MFRKLYNEELGRISLQEYKSAPKAPLAVVLDNVRSGHNVGSALRTCDAFRIEKVWLCGICAVPPSPEVHKTGDRFILYYTADEHLRAATGPTPTGPFVEQDGYLLQPLIATESCSDINRFTDEDGSSHLFFVRKINGVSSVWTCGLEADGLTVKGPLRTVSTPSQAWEKEKGSVNCAPFVLKKDNRYFFTYTGNEETSLGCGIGYIFAPSLTRGMRKYQGNPIWQRPEGTWLTGTGHASFFFSPDSTLYCVFDAHNTADKVYPRLMYITTASITDGTLSINSDNLIRPIISADKSAGIPLPPADAYRFSSRRVSGTLTIENTRDLPFEWEVVSLHGKKMKKGSTHSLAHISFADMPQGLYIVHLTNAAGEHSEKVLRI